MNIYLKYVSASKFTRSATANKINLIVPKRAADDLHCLFSRIGYEILK